MLYAQQSAQFASAGGSFPPGGWRKFWGLSVLPKWKRFVWKLLSRGIPVGEVLVRRGIPVFSGCLFCGQTEESVTHLYRDCVHVQPFWLGGPLGCFVSPLVGSFQDWCVGGLLNILNHKAGLSMPDDFFNLLWAIWLVRNDVRFRSVPFFPLSISFAWDH